MNPTETFGEFSQRLTPTDLMLYAGVGIVLWVLFKEKLTPIRKTVVDFFNKNNPAKTETKVLVPTESKTKNSDVFFDLVVSWKHTRDLAVLSGCSKAVEVADQMFPYLSPNVCKETTDELPKAS
jgi:hypothetical protein